MVEELAAEYFLFLQEFRHQYEFHDFRTFKRLLRYLKRQLKPYRGLKTMFSKEIVLRFFNTLGFNGPITKCFAEQICESIDVYFSQSIDKWCCKLLETIHTDNRLKFYIVNCTTESV